MTHAMPLRPEARWSAKHAHATVCSKRENNHSLCFSFDISIQPCVKPRLTQTDLARCCTALRVPRPESGEIFDTLKALGDFFLPRGMEGPSEAAYWMKQFFKSKKPDEDLLKDCEFSTALASSIIDDSWRCHGQSCPSKLDEHSNIAFPNL